MVYILLFVGVHAKDYRGYTQVKRVIHTLVTKHHFKRAELEKLFSHVKVQHSALRAFLPRHKQKRYKDQRSKAQI